MPARRKVTEESLLDAAARVFARQGYEGSSIDDLLDELDVARPTLYAHTRSKHDLLESVYRRLVRVYLEELARHVRAGDPPLRRIRGLVEVQLAVCLRHRESVMLVTRQTIADADRRSELRGWWRSVDSMLLATIREAQAAGELDREIEPRLIAHAMWATLNDIPYWFDPDGRVRPADLADQFVRLFAGGRG